ncbi:inositol monophosphatase family protein [Bifidobacterium callimiconis]|uniref:Inositol monophosphatase n=1 Tax=Bifidobacterium callimiconis TaxID=2306973 RepID=A0A430FGV0_9BIFI|nr:inositol monophosphatase family protein [Bifidobacterium callimiconis]MBT1176596.1 inositol monophosphatase family protein [Bifidobacterium callimiconis]RSX51948.1 inositol monophosphatase [Bifidobacterium callimiconis]
MTDRDLRELTVKVAEVLKDAGELALQDQIKPHDLTKAVHTKTRQGSMFSSEVDERLVRYCHERINAIEAHECWEEIGSDTKPGGLYWCIGHVDGSINYVRNMPEWTVTVSLFEVDDDNNGIPVLGVVHAPALGLTYMAAQGKGAIRVRETKQGPKREKIMPSTTDTLKDSVVSFGMSYFPEESARALKTVAAIAGKPADVKRVGPVSMDLCKVADGTYDAYFEPSLHSWDVAGVSAGSVVLREAQGHIERWDGTDVVWGANNDIVASNGPIMDELRPYLN